MSGKVAYPETPDADAPVAHRVGLDMHADMHPHRERVASRYSLCLLFRVETAGVGVVEWCSGLELTQPSRLLPVQTPPKRAKESPSHGSPEGLEIRPIRGKAGDGSAFTM